MSFIPAPNIRVAIVEDQDKIRSALEMIIDGTPGMLCVGAFESAEAFLESDLQGIDVVLLDIGLPGMSGTEAIAPIRNRWPRADLLMLTVYQDEERVFKAICAGAVGYLLKTTPPAQIVDAVREVNEGGAPMSPSIARKVVGLMRQPAAAAETLSDRENEVLNRIVEGKTNKQIADELMVSTNTVAFHLKQIYKKLHVHSRAEVVAKVMQRGW